jgi:WD40 repeat protein
MISEEQEIMLGDVVAEQEMSVLKVLEIPEVSGHLQGIVDRLVAQMPPSKIKFRAYVVDEPENNAFTLPGGRIFVTKKMVAFAKSEDELAGVLAHELGHQVTHQMAYRWSKIFRDLLGANSVGDRADIEEKYHQYLEMYRKKEGALPTGEDAEKEQLGADQVAVFAMAKAGYSPNAVVEFWDRFAETKGKKGNFFTDMFGSTLPDSKRLREFAKNLGTIPASCVQKGHASSEDFSKWQLAVKNYSGFGKNEALHDVAMRKPLQPALRGDLHHLKFSPDGQYLLGQDDASIFVMRVDPLESLFRIDAADANPAQFSPDSKSVVFYDSGLHVEKWSIADKHAEEVNEVHEIRGCIQTALSPDGKLLACVIPNRETFFPLDLELIDVNTGQPAFLKKNFTGPASLTFTSYLNFLMVAGGRTVVAMAFSPDGKYFIVSRPDAHLMVDLGSRTEQSMSGDLKKYTSVHFAFVGPDKIVGADGPYGEHGAAVKVPSGQVVQSDVPLGPLATHPAAQGDYVILKPLPKAPIGIMDLKRKQVFLASKTDAIDIYGNKYVSERVNGEIGLYETPHTQEGPPGLTQRSEGGSKPIATLILPRSPLTRVYAAALSPDLNSFALSDRTRGAVWDLASGNRLVYVRGFRGARFAPKALYFDFTAVNQFTELQTKDENDKEARKRESDKPDHSLAKVDFEAKKISEVAGFKKRNHLHQAGSVMLITTPQDDEQPGKQINMEARDFASGDVLWSRKFPKTPPAVFGNDEADVVALAWYLGASGVKDELRDDPDAKKMVENIKDNEGSYLVEVLDARKGTVLGKFPIDSGRSSFRIRNAYAGAGMVVIVDNHQRVLLYDYKGQRKGRMFGRFPSISNDGKLLCVEPEPGRIKVYELSSMRLVDQFTFASRVVYDAFTEDDQRLAVLTEDQTLYVLNVAAKSAATMASAETKQAH